jgi:hypothetical protein
MSSRQESILDLVDLLPKLVNNVKELKKKMNMIKKENGNLSPRRVSVISECDRTVSSGRPTILSAEYSAE